MLYSTTFRWRNQKSMSRMRTVPAMVGRHGLSSLLQWRLVAWLGGISEPTTLPLPRYRPELQSIAQCSRGRDTGWRAKYIHTYIAVNSKYVVRQPPCKDLMCDLPQDLWKQEYLSERNINRTMAQRLTVVSILGNIHFQHVSHTHECEHSTMSKRKFSSVWEHLKWPFIQL